jgi:hypothetical protein
VTFSTFHLAEPKATNYCAMPLEWLLLSRDPEVIRVLRPALEKLSIDVGGM